MAEKTEKEKTIAECVSIVRTFCGEEMRRTAHLPQHESTWKGNFITTFESDLIKQLKFLLK